MSQRVSRNVKVLSITMLLSSALIAGGIAYAAGDTITACVNKSTGLTRIISGKMKCYKKERQVTWNQTGPTGSQGATGSSGTSVGIYKTSITSVGVTSGNTENIFAVVIPSGKYIFNFGMEARLFTNSAATTKTRFAQCFMSTIANPATAYTTGAQFLWPSAGQAQPYRVGFSPVGAGQDSDTKILSGTGIFEFAQSTNVYFHCNHVAPGNSDVTTGQEIILNYPSFTATKLDSLSAS